MHATMAEYKRIRVVFKDDDILSESQKSEGLNRSWLLLKINQQHATVSDIASHLLHAFQLHHSCPNGLLLSVSGFVFPQFESTSILKEDEVIRVMKRRNALSVEGNNAANGLEKLESVEQQPVTTGVLLLANKEFEKDKGGYESDDTEEESEEKVQVDRLQGIVEASGSNADLNNRKRKAPEKLQGSKKKKQHSESPEDVANDAGVPAKKKFRSRKEEKPDSSSEDNIENNEESASPSEKNDVSVAGLEQNAELQENSEETDDAKIAPKETKKGPSRSSRRKYAKRKWLREMAKIQKTASESEGLRNWKKGHAKAERNKHDQPKGQKWKRQRADAGKTDDGEPKGLLHWMQSPQKNLLVKGKHRREQNQNVSFHKHPNQNSVVAENTSSTKTYSKEAEALVKEAIQEQKERFLHQKKPNQNDDEAVQTNLIADEHRMSNQDGAIHEQTNKRNGDAQLQPNQQSGDVQEQSNQNGDASEQSNQESDEENDVVPIVVRPGHIRFAPLGKEQAFQQKHEPADTFQWNGITSKKKEQKWGTEKCAFTTRNENKNPNKDLHELVSNEKEKQPHGAVDLEKLPPLTSTPKEGDLIAYRVLELSSSWTPELSTLRVGKVSYYNSKSGKTRLLPLLDYPIVSKTDEDGVQLDSSLYKEDGSLEIDFSALIDARIFKDECSELMNETSSHVSEAPVAKESTPKAVLPSSSKEQALEPSAVVETGEPSQSKETQPPAAENGGVDPWDQISEALNAKKEELAKESGWGKPPKKLQVVQHNNCGKNAKNVQSLPVNNSWGKNAKNVQSLPVNNSWGNKSGKNVNSSPVNNSWRKNVQSSPGNSWVKNGNNVQLQSPMNSWGKNGQPSQGNSWGNNAENEKENCWGGGGKSWSLRGSGLGQTMDILRSKNDT